MPIGPPFSKVASHLGAARSRVSPPGRLAKSRKRRPSLLAVQLPVRSRGRLLGYVQLLLAKGLAIQRPSTCTRPGSEQMAQGRAVRLPRPPSRAHLKALVWFWIIDETLVLTSMLSVCRLNEVGTCQVMEQVMIMVMMVMTTR